MKKILIVFLVSTLGVTATFGQISVTHDSGVKIGTTPKSSASAVPSWQLPSSGLEVSIGQVLFHLPQYTSVRMKSRFNYVHQPNGSIAATPVSEILGTNLILGNNNNLLYQIYTARINSTTALRVTSDRRAKDNIKSINKATNKVMQLRPVKYDLKVWDGYSGDTSELEGKAGFIAQEVLEVLPDAVGYLDDVDRYTLEYSHFIPYLTKAIQEQEERLEEQEEELEEQEERIDALEEMLEAFLDQDIDNSIDNTPATNSITNGNNGISASKLYQNTPNPFNTTTTIEYELSKECKNAQLIIYTSNGRTVANFSLSETAGKSQIVLPEGLFKAGVYVYSLYEGDKLIDTKRMIVIN